MGLIHYDDPLAMPRTGGPKWSASIAGEFQDTIQPEQWRKHDAQAAYDPDAMPVQTVRNPCEGADDKRPADLTEWAARAIYGGAVLLGLAWWMGWL